MDIYIVLHALSPNELAQQLNEAAAKGYRAVEFVHINNKHLAIMELQAQAEEPKKAAPAAKVSIQEASEDKAQV